MSNSVFPEDIMLCILARLPVKSIIRFTSVCKPWRKLFSTQEFVRMHHDQFSSDSKKYSFMVHRISESLTDTMSLFNLESNEKEPTILDHPFSYIRIGIDIVGCCNGLFCVNPPAFGQLIVFWNPAMNMSKRVWPSKLAGDSETVSLGFGYDAVGADFKVVRIVYLKNRRDGQYMDVDWVDVYSVNSRSWVTVEVDFQFSVFQTKSDVIVNGNPHWVATVNENENGKSGPVEVLICFDVTELVFKVVSLSTLYHDEEANVELVNWKGCLGALVFASENQRVESLDVWVFDDVEQIWRNTHTFGPIKKNVYRLLLCWKNGKILGECPDGKLFVFDPETGCVKDLFYGAQQSQTFEIYGYTESLSYVKGMEKEKVRGRKRWRG
ncbi:hypothetical protein OROGR_022693 [Orobanche gracilis]